MPTGSIKKVRSHKSLWAAWRKVRASALKSQSEASRAEAREFELNAHSEIPSISSRISKGSFRFDPGYGVPISKTGKKSVRPIIRSSLSNRVVSRAILDTFIDDERFHQFFNSSCNFGALPNRRVAHAWEAVLTEISNGNRWYIQSDIEKFFDRIPKSVVKQRFSLLIEDSNIKELFNKALEVELSNASELGHFKTYFPLDEIGIAQGNALSPLIANVILDEFDKTISALNVRLVRYVDDFIILGKTQKAVKDAFIEGRKVLKKLGLNAYHPSDESGKSTEGATDNGFEFLGVKYSPGLLAPNRDSRKSLQEKVREKIKLSLKASKELDGDALQQHNYLSTCKNVSNILKGWGNYYSFCNNYQVISQLDEWVNKSLTQYRKKFWAGLSNDQKSTPEWHRRMFGVFLLKDSKKEPLL